MRIRPQGPRLRGCLFAASTLLTIVVVLALAVGSGARVALAVSASGTVVNGSGYAVNEVTLSFPDGGGEVTGSVRLASDPASTCQTGFEATLSGRFPDGNNQLSGTADAHDWQTNTDPMDALCGLGDHDDRFETTWSATWSGTTIRGEIYGHQFELSAPARPDTPSEPPPTTTTIPSQTTEGNRNPDIYDLFFSPSAPVAGEEIFIQVDAVDPDGDELFYSWFVTGVAQTIDQAAVAWENPIEGTHDVTVVVRDGRGGEASASVNIVVGPVQGETGTTSPTATPTTIPRIDEQPVLPSTTVQVTTTVLLPTTTATLPTATTTLDASASAPTTTAAAPVVVSASTVPSAQNQTDGTSDTAAGGNAGDATIDAPGPDGRSDMERIADSLREDGGVPSGTTVVLAGGASLLLLAGTVLASPFRTAPAREPADEIQKAILDDLKAAVSVRSKDFQSAERRLEQLNRQLKRFDDTATRYRAALAQKANYDDRTSSDFRPPAGPADHLGWGVVVVGFALLVRDHKKLGALITVIGGGLQLLSHYRPWISPSGFPTDTEVRIVGAEIRETKAKVALMRKQLNKLISQRNAARTRLGHARHELEKAEAEYDRARGPIPGSDPSPTSSADAWRRSRWPEAQGPRR